MDFSKLQSEFKGYLKNLNNSKSETNNNQTEKKYDLKNKKVSIFSYAEEFDNFLNKKYKSKIKNSAINTDDILKMKFKDGKFEEGKETDENKLPLVCILNDLLKDEKMKFIIDSDGDSKISQDEIKGFLDAIDEIDGKDGELSLDDLLAGTKAIQELDLTKYMKDDASFETQNVQPARTSSPSSVGGGYNAGGSGGYNSGAAGVSNTPQPQGETLEELEQQKTEKETDVTNAQNAYNAVFSGTNENVKAAVESFTKAKEDYEKLVDEEKNLTEEQKTQLKEADKNIEDKKAAVNDAEKALQDADNAVKSQESVIAEDESNLSALQSSLGALQGQTSDDKDKQSEINSKISELRTKISVAEKKLNDDKSKLEELKEKKAEAEKTLTEKKDDLTKAQEDKKKLEEELIVNNENVSQQLKDALNNYRQTETNVDTVKSAEAAKAKDAITKAQGELDEINTKINEKKAEQTKKENSVSTFNFDFEENLSDTQKSALESFKENYANNKDKYEEVAKRTGVPAELIAAIHWRESSGDFTTYLHNGEKLGQTTTLVPEGIYFGADQWTEAAVDALQRQGCSDLNGNDLNDVLDFAERYNGLGYRNKGVASPYVWAGTTNYHGGKYVADGVYDPNHYDQQLGVAVMMKSIS